MNIGGEPLAEGGYWLVVARLEPENNIDLIVRAYGQSSSTLPLVIVGDCSSDRYRRVLSDAVAGLDAGKRVVMAGSIYEKQRLDDLRCCCAAYVHGHSVGGTNPSLLEAMSAGNVVICHDNPFNREVSATCAKYFNDEGSLSVVLDEIEQDPMRFSHLREMARQRVKEHNDWNKIVDQHDLLFSEIRNA